MDHADALRVVQPHLVISSWQPMGQDWTADIRASDSVVEYLLVGETVRVCALSLSMCPS